MLYGHVFLYVVNLVATKASYEGVWGGIARLSRSDISQFFEWLVVCSRYQSVNVDNTCVVSFKRLARFRYKFMKVTI